MDDSKGQEGAGHTEENSTGEGSSQALGSKMDKVCFEATHTRYMNAA